MDCITKFTSLTFFPSWLSLIASYGQKIWSRTYLNVANLVASLKQPTCEGELTIREHFETGNESRLPVLKSMVICAWDMTQNLGSSFKPASILILYSLYVELNRKLVHHLNRKLSSLRASDSAIDWPTLLSTDTLIYTLMNTNVRHQKWRERRTFLTKVWKG